MAVGLLLLRSLWSSTRKSISSSSSSPSSRFFSHAFAAAPASVAAGPSTAGSLDPSRLRNVAVIAHVDHGKTTLMDRILRQCGADIPHERAMDSNSLERERGITIASKVTTVSWKDHELNMVDTPGHADFGGEVERVVGMVEGAVLVVDAGEGPLAQTKFVFAKALKYGLRPLLLLNKVDRPSVTEETCDCPTQQYFQNHMILRTELIKPWVSRHGQILYSLFEACSTVRSLDATKRLHALSVTAGPLPKQSIFLHNNIISSYASHGELLHARKVFNLLPEKTVVSYNTLISAYGRIGNVGNAWMLLQHMRESGFVPTQYTLTGLLTSESLNLSQGVQLLALSIKNGLFDADAFVGTALLGFFGRHGCLDEAFLAFEDMPQKSLVSWNSMLSLLARNGFVEDSKVLFRDLVGLGISLSEGSFVALLSGLVDPEEDLEYGEQVHGLMTKCGIDCEINAVNSLIHVYVRCGAMSSAERLFEKVPIQNVVSWNMFIDAFVKSERPEMAMEMFKNMSSRGLRPSQATFVAVLDSCTSLRNLVYGKSIHAKVIGSGFESDVIVGTALVNFYAKCDKLLSAHNCFNRIEEKNVVSWNSLISGYSNICSSKSILLLREMLQLGYFPNEFSFSAVLKSSSLSDLHQLHGLVIRKGYESCEYVLSSLVMAYTRNGLLNEALAFFEGFNYPLPVIPSNIIAGVYNKTSQYNETIKLLSLLEKPDIVSWNIVISACARSNNYNEVFELFKHMHSARIRPDKYTFMSVLCVCTKLCSLDLGSSLHGLIMKTNLYNCDTFLCNALIDMYGKCGRIDSSVKVFEEITDRNIITWTTLISALGLNGYAREAVNRFQTMELMGLKPDRLALRAVLSSCRYGGLVSEGMQIFRKMGNIYGIQPEIDHYHCLVDLLVKNGQIVEADKIIASMPFPPNASIWRSFLEGYRGKEIAA